MSNSIIKIHFQEIFEAFKANVKNNIFKENKIIFDEIIKVTFSSLQIDNYLEEDIFLFKKWFSDIYEHTFLNDLIANNEFNEIIIHSPEHIQIQIFNNSKTLSYSLSPDDFQLALEVLCFKHQIDWNYSNPFQSFNLETIDKSVRLSLIHYSTSANKKSKLFIRCHSNNQIPLEKFNLKNNDSNFIDEILKSKSNIIIAGSTNSGKTTLLKTLINDISVDEHVIILEDTNEIKTINHCHTFLISDDKNEHKTLTQYCAYAMRMKPDRIIIGELRSNEVVPFILAMNSGHKGLMSTIHANSAVDTVHRINLLFSIYNSNLDIKNEYITSLVCKNIDYIFYLKDKKIAEVIKLLGNEGTTPYFETIYQAS